MPFLELFGSNSEEEILSADLFSFKLNFAEDGC